MRPDPEASDEDLLKFPFPQLFIEVWVPVKAMCRELLGNLLFQAVQCRQP
jgi:hypothetical protein